MLLASSHVSIPSFLPSFLHHFINSIISAAYNHLLNGYGVAEVLTGLLSHPTPLIAATAAQPLRNLLHKG